MGKQKTIKKSKKRRKIKTYHYLEYSRWTLKTIVPKELEMDMKE